MSILTESLFKLGWITFNIFNGLLFLLSKYIVELDLRNKAVLEIFHVSSDSLYVLSLKW